MVWVQRVEPDIASDESIGAVDQFVDGLGVVESRAILGLHEPAGRRNAEDVQVVLDTAADEPAIAVERIGMVADRQRR